MIPDAIPVEPDLARRVRARLRSIMRDLAVIMGAPEYATIQGMREAISAVLIPLRELDCALPPDDNGDPMPHPPDLQSLDGTSDQHCAPPIRLPLNSARALVEVAIKHSNSLNDLLAEVLPAIPEELRKPTTLKFARPMGYLYTELTHPLQNQHEELRELVFGDEKP